MLQYGLIAALMGAAIFAGASLIQIPVDAIAKGLGAKTVAVKLIRH